MERRGGKTQAPRELSYGASGLASSRLGGLDVVVREVRRTASGTAKTPCGGETRLGTLPDQAALEFSCATRVQGSRTAITACVTQGKVRFKIVNSAHKILRSSNA